MEEINESWILIRGDHASRFPELFKMFEGYFPTGRVFTANNREKAYSFTGYEDRDKDGTWEIVQKTVFVLGPWTVIDDPELILFDDLEGLQKVSTFIGGPVVAFQCLPRSSKFGFRYVTSNQNRSIVHWSGKITENEGNPIAEERGLNLDQMNQTECTKLLMGLLIDYEFVNHVKEFKVYELDESGVMEEDEASEETSTTQKKTNTEEMYKSPEVKDPWWKFW